MMEPPISVEEPLVIKTRKDVARYKSAEGVDPRPLDVTIGNVEELSLAVQLRHHQIAVELTPSAPLDLLGRLPKPAKGGNVVRELCLSVHHDMKVPELPEMKDLEGLIYTGPVSGLLCVLRAAPNLKGLACSFQNRGGVASLLNSFPKLKCSQTISLLDLHDSPFFDHKSEGLDVWKNSDLPSLTHLHMRGDYAMPLPLFTRSRVLHTLRLSSFASANHLDPGNNREGVLIGTLELSFPLCGTDALIERVLSTRVKFPELKLLVHPARSAPVIIGARLFKCLPFLQKIVYNQRSDGKFLEGEMVRLSGLRIKCKGAVPEYAKEGLVPPLSQE